jgi:hypothetical protein
LAYHPGQSTLHPHPLAQPKPATSRAAQVGTVVALVQHGGSVFELLGPRMGPPTSRARHPARLAAADGDQGRTLVGCA